ncbi:PIG-L family deacetylase [Leptothermofonsia sichuanensis E412]|uniref:PIG-L deacetylase family protein n=1 Tax=Leptothermofonsia sichuanensis TaxID=2917832 RepID=UPI001CA66B8F|nr:PIG-L deacetylase family protein [Leptothermofonsia sichuanensis]QZZ22107.1 PIG-L family deacetylase [Leptothermofonsia sichuanensis E412]
MLQSVFFQKGKEPLRQVLCVGAHSDDIEIGCGGTVLKLMDAVPDLSIYWVVLSGSGDRRAEALASANAFLHSASHKTILVEDFKDTFFPYIGAEIKEYFRWLGKEVSPDLILTHYRQDLHQDHRLVSELTWNTFRNHLILEYEIPKYDGDIGNPNCFVHLSEEICNRKIDYLFEHFGSQSNKSWFCPELFRSTLRLRGMESNSPSKYAEAFYCRKMVF